MSSKKFKKLSDYKIDGNLFFNIQYKETAYLLGLLWADGYIYLNNRAATINIEFLKSDYWDIKNIFYFHGRWSDYENRPKFNRQLTARLSTSNRPVAELLAALDYTSKSNSPCAIINCIPENLKHYWFRGLFDGDGCYFLSKLNYSNVSITSCYEQDWKYMLDLCHKINIKGKIKIRKKPLPEGSGSRFLFTSSIDSIKFCDYIYQDYENDKIGFTRKYEKYIKGKLSFNPKQKTSKFKGVFKFRNKWRASLRKNNKVIYLGDFNTEEEAYSSYLKFNN